MIQATVLGVVQGLTEFLPVSSSGHLVLVRWLFGWTTGDLGLDKAFDVAVHVGTLAGAIAYLRADVAALARGALESVRMGRADTPVRRLPWLVAAAVAPAAITGVAFESAITERLGRPGLVAVMLVAFAFVLAAADRVPARRSLEGLDLRSALAVGAAQAVALQPGVSRSGVTMSMARVLGYDRDASARLSFLMALPLVAGAAAFEAVDLGGTALPDGFVAVLAVGSLSAAATAAASVWGLLALVRRRSFAPFVVYRVVLGIAVLVAIAAGWR